MDRVGLCASATVTACLRPVTLVKQGFFGRVIEGLATCALNDALPCSCIRAGRNQASKSQRKEYKYVLVPLVVLLVERSPRRSPKQPFHPSRFGSETRVCQQRLVMVIAYLDT